MQSFAWFNLQSVHLNCCVNFRVISIIFYLETIFSISYINPTVAHIKHTCLVRLPFFPQYLFMCLHVTNMSLSLFKLLGTFLDLVSSSSILMIYLWLIFASVTFVEDSNCSRDWIYIHRQVAHKKLKSLTVSMCHLLL